MFGPGKSYGPSCSRWPRQGVARDLHSRCIARDDWLLDAERPDEREARDKLVEVDREFEGKSAESTPPLVDILHEHEWN